MNDKDTNDYRKVEINTTQRIKFVDNHVRTTKYRIYSFLPVFLFYQFRSYSNIFFLAIGIIQQFPGVSPLGKYTTFIPLAIILFISGLKELFEDVMRYREDKKVNDRITQVWNSNSWINTTWKKVKVGHFIRVSKNEEFPADILLIGCSNPITGVVYVDTVNLDGESNLKVRRTPHQFLETDLYQMLEEMRGTVICDHPNEQIYRFNGSVIISEGFRVPVNEDQLMLRGAILRNTDWVCGICIYTGVDTKIWRNLQKKEPKRSSFDYSVNWHMMVLFTIFFFLTFFNSIMYLVWNFRMREIVWYLPFGQNLGLKYQTFLTFAVSYSFMIPISLQIYQEIIRLFQAKYINKDKKMYDDVSNCYAHVRSSSLNPDLGIVKYIFSDKTGTLTRNQLEFRACSIQGDIYTDDAVSKLMANCENEMACHHFFVAICVAPGVIPIYNEKKNQWDYYSSSTDQLALVNAAKKFGYELRQRTYKQAIVYIRGNLQKFRILGDIEFTNERRRTTVIVRDSENRIFLYMLGADDVVFQRLSPKSLFIEKTAEQIYTFALSGLRTLVIANAVIRENDFRKWNRTFVRAKLDMKDRQTEISNAANKIEKDLMLLGAVAQEDKLQDEVPETIYTFLQAGVKVWMLTGDKQETAINIGYSTKLLSGDSTLFILNSESAQILKRSCVQIARHIKDTRKPCMVVNGNSITHIMDSDFIDCFVSIVMNCESVICCRMIPLQKAQIVKLIQDKTNSVTLAVGDGANDVAMIQSAAIGVGISGVEGLQAVYAADYAIASFKFLRRLLLVHGTLNYYRQSKIMYFIYYKNLPIALALFYLSYSSGWSGTSIFDDWAFTLYNVIFTDGATFALGAMEKDFEDNILYNGPQIYRENTWANTYFFYAVIANAVLHSILIQYLTVNIFSTGILWNNGYNDHYLVVGSILYTYILILVTMKSLLHFKNWSWVSVIGIVSFALLWVPLLFLYNFTVLPISPQMYDMAEMLLSMPLFWITIFIVPFASIFFDFFCLAVFRLLTNAKKY